MRFKWDDKKRQRNLLNHGFDFVDVEAFFAGKILTAEDDRVDYRERRFASIGMPHGCCVSVVHTETDDAIRVISIRKATKYEQAQYVEVFPPG